jgi:hypothetical protein
MYNQFKRFLPVESSGDIVHVEKSGRFDVDVWESLFMRRHFVDSFGGPPMKITRDTCRGGWASTEANTGQGLRAKLSWI